MNNLPTVVAFHLPQFHAIPENDRWWGKGFTEWHNTRKAVPLFPGHDQPRTPLDENYYDLSHIEDIKWEMELARKYGIGAFCYYHYWFNGKLLLEKPLELMRELDERIDYFFCWANEPWIRSWQGSKDVLVAQEYGNEAEWQQHFDYLLPFFQDEHYRKLENKPVFVLYRANNIPRCEDMIAYFDAQCRKHGFDGIYLIEERNNFQTKKHCTNSQAILDFEPMYTLTHGRTSVDRLVDKMRKAVFNRKYRLNLLLFSYDKVWKTILSRTYGREEKHYLGGFVDWDNTARKGKNGTVIKGYTPEKFQKYFTRQFERCIRLGSELLFINAWNEWGEGTYLEPDTHYGYRNLEIVNRVIEEHKRMQ